jgi:hypothetical protein
VTVVTLSPPESQMESSDALDGKVYYREIGVKRLLCFDIFGYGLWTTKSTNIISCNAMHTSQLV